ncbi:MAG TPA: tetratricopeptide repeat protein, partial [Verrucomicrobiales bacterium]|nr:tetratricopeptide repeat protein [Verrucomicrobiales bacterium]
MSPRFPTLLSGLLLPLLLAEVSPSQEPNAKAVRLLDPLTKRPGSAPLFERFVNAWLDTDTLEGLGKFLAGRVAASPTTPNRLLLALFYSRQGEPVKALEEFRAALASDPGSAEIWYQKALLESRTLDFESALVSLGKCLGAHPPAGLSVQASQLLGRLQVRAGRTEEALKTWRALMEARPADEELREDILELQISENLWPAAQETATALVERTADPYRRVLRRMRLGDVFDRAGQRDKALETFAACLADTGEGSWLEKEILGQMEKLFRREDDVAGLKDYFAGLLPKHSRRAGLQRAQARLLMETGETDAAIACGRALMALSPGDRAVREEFIALLTGAGRAVDAIPQVEQLLHHTPDDLELRLTLADLKYTAKDAPGALAELRVYEQKAASQEGTPLRVAGLLDRYGMADDAIQTLRTALARTPNQPELQLMLASLLHSSGKKEEALAEWHRLASDGSLPIVQQTARAMHSRGEGAAAWQVMQAASSKAGNDAIFLSLLCSLADNAERAREAGPLALRLVELSKSTADLNSALEVALRVIRLAENGDTFTAKLAQTATTAQSLCLLATLREAARDTLGANNALEKARAMSPELALSQAVRLWTMRGDFGQAAMAAEKLFNSPGGRQGHVAEMLVSLHQRAGNPEAALRWTQEWRKLVPGAVAPVIGEAKLLQAAGREADALSALRTAAGRFEGNSDIRAQLAAASLQNGRTAEALRLYSGLYEDAPDLAAKMRWVQQWAQAALNAGRLEELISQFEDRRRENRESVVPLMALAELHRVAENYDARRQALMEAARLKPGDSEIALEIARLESREQNDEAAIRTLRPYLAKDSSGRVSALMAELLLNTGREEEGLKLITESTAPTAGSVENAAISLARRGDEKAALTWLRAQREAWPDDWRLAYLQCVLEWRTEQTADTPERLLKLAAASSPLSRLNTSSAVAPSATFESQVIQIMPAGTRRFFKLLQASSAVSVMTGRSLSYVILPSDPEEMQESAAALLLEISKSAPPEKSAVWMEALERLGFPSARLIPELPPIRRLLLTDRGEDLTSLLEAHPESHPLLALAAYTAAYSNWELPAESRMAEQAWAAFRQEAPLAALFLALPGAGHSGKPAAWEEEVLAAAGKMEKAPPLILAAVSRGAGLFSDDEDSRAAQAVNPEWRKRLISLAQRWQQALDAAGTPASLGWDARSFIFTGLAREYTAAKEAPALASLLDAEWRWYESRPQPPRQSSGEESLVRSLEFPPKSLPGLPDYVLSYFQRYLTPEMAAAT